MSSVCLSVRPSVSLSVCLSVTLVDFDHIGWNTFEIISPLLAWDVRSLQTQTSWVYSKGNTRKYWPKVTNPPVDLNVGDIRSQIAAEWLQIAQRPQWRAYRKLPSLFLILPSLTPYDLPGVWRGGSMVSARDSRSEGREFDPRPRHTA